MCVKRSITKTIFCLITLFVIGKSAEGSSIYAIPDHSPPLLYKCKINVYDILLEQQLGQLEYKEDLSLSERGAIDVTIDPNSDILFTSYEGKYFLELTNARTLTSEGTVSIPGITSGNLAGVVMDQIDPNTTRLYTIDRGTNHLYVYNWDSEEKVVCYPYFDPVFMRV